MANLCKPNNRRYNAVLNILSDHCWHSTRELVQRSGMCAINTIISELRQHGCEIECRQVRRPAYGTQHFFEYILNHAPTDKFPQLERYN